MNKVEKVNLLSDMYRHPKRVSCRVDGVGNVPLATFSGGKWSFRTKLVRACRSHSTVTIWFKGRRISISPGTSGTMRLDAGQQVEAFFDPTAHVTFYDLYAVSSA